MNDRFYVTTPIYYVNDVPHLGHAYTTVVADALARYHRCRGHAVHFLTGTDEHGQKIEEAAQKSRETPQRLADRVVAGYRDTWQRLDITHDDFIRTTEERHQRVVRALWSRIADAGDIYLGDYEDWYCVGCEAFYTETQLLEGCCPVHKLKVERVKEPSYFFRMSRYQERLLRHFEEHPEFVRPENRYNEMLSFVRSGLRDLSISRTTFRWGIVVPGDPSHVIYVWLDALANYVSALGGFDGSQPVAGSPGEHTAEHGDGHARQRTGGVAGGEPGGLGRAEALYRRFWPADVHLIGKDILRFHAVYWPCFLLSAGLPLPRTVFAHGWWTVRGEKISKSIPATRVDPRLLASDIGADSLRYFLLREVPLGLDGDFSFEALIGRHNSDLANDLGNLLQRSLAMTERYCEGLVPDPEGTPEGGLDQALQANAQRARDEAARQMEALAPSRACEAIWELVRFGNKYIDESAPWSLFKDAATQPRLRRVVYNFLEALRWISLLCAPVIPAKASEIRAQLGLGHADAAGQLRSWPEEWGGLPAGLPISRGESLFPRIDEEQAAALLGRWVGAPQAATPTAATGAATTPATRPTATAATTAARATARTAAGAGARARPATGAERSAGTVSAPAGGGEQPERGAASGVGEISYDEFARLDLRVGVIVEAEPVPKADRLLRLMVDIGGGDRRQVVAGIADVYTPSEVVGRRVIFLANLRPAKIRGVVSQGMVLAAGAERVLALSALDREVAAGTKVR